MEEWPSSGARPRPPGSVFRSSPAFRQPVLGCRERSELTGWKDATPVSAAMTQLSTVGRTLKGGRKFAQGTKLCVKFNVVQGECAVIHR